MYSAKFWILEQSPKSNQIKTRNTGFFWRVKRAPLLGQGKEKFPKQGQRAPGAFWLLGSEFGTERARRSPDGLLVHSGGRGSGSRHRLRGLLHRRRSILPAAPGSPQAVGRAQVRRLNCCVRRGWRHGLRQLRYGSQSLPRAGPCGPDAQLRGLAPLGESAWPVDSVSYAVIPFLLPCLAYSLDEVDQMTRELRKKSKQPVPEDASGFEVVLQYVKFKSLVSSFSLAI